MNGYWQRAGTACLCMGSLIALLSALSGCSDDAASHPRHLADAGADARAGGDVGANDAGPQDTGPDSAGAGDTGAGDTGPSGDAGPDTDTRPRADAGPDADAGGTGGLILRGHLAPAGGLSMSRSFTLSGELRPGHPATESASAHYRLKAQPPALEVTP